ncbi:hypothetical protein B566_EDAN008999 [Ephemera danica]|nr:hypothetical protein B566_EDAN008999 [Ephemera danica]
MNLTMRLGDHMMLIQLQLSTVTPKLSSSSSSSSSTNSSSSTSRSSTLRNSSSSNTSPISTSPRQPAHRQQTTPSSQQQQPATPTTAAAAAAAAASPPTPTQTKCRCDPSKQPALDTRALAEASRNLTQTLKQLSSEVLTSRSGGSSSSSSTSSSSATPVMSSTSSMDFSEESSRRRQGAIIESMHHHGKGVYSGTFSGTLNPALQDKFGRPKRDISTIIHILNDLLCATPQYRGATATSATVSNSSSSSRRHNAAQQQSDAAALNDHDYAEGCEGSAQLSKENQATRGKMEQLRQFMEERRARRRARREARVAPYSAAQWAASKTAPSGSTSPVMSPAAPVEGRPCEARASIAASATDGNPATPMDTSEGAGAELCELNPEPVLA